MSLDEQIGSRFRCSKCKHHGGEVKRIAATGSGISKLLDIQHNQFLAVSCKNCGFTEFYNPDMLGDRRKLGTILDILFER
jgi:predicted nucleic-acid-binding Zn-ribbon protein